MTLAAWTGWVWDRRVYDFVFSDLANIGVIVADGYCECHPSSMLEWRYTRWRMAEAGRAVLNRERDAGVPALVNLGTPLEEPKPATQPPQPDPDRPWRIKSP